MAERIEQTLFVLKPDALIHSLAGSVIARISDAFNAFALTKHRRIGIIYSAQKVVAPTAELLKAHYAHLSDKPYFGSTVDYIMGLHHYTEPWGRQRGLGPDEVARYRRLLVWAIAGEGVTKLVKRVLGPTDPEEAKQIAENSIRAQHGEKRPALDPKDPTKIVGYLFYNVAHASNEGEQGRELRLWFKPEEFCHDAYRRPLGVELARKHYYLTPGNRVTEQYGPGSLCIAAPGEMIWTEDRRILEDHLRHDGQSKYDLSVAVAKYKLNRPTGRLDKPLTVWQTIGDTIAGLWRRVSRR